MNSEYIIKPIPEIHFGEGKISELSVILGDYGKSTLILTGGSSFIKAQQWQELQQLLVENSIEYFCEQIRTEPTPEMVDEITDKYHDRDIFSVVAIGGGSVLDAGKAVSAMIPKGTEVVQFLEGVGTNNPDGSKVPFVAIPTTSGTGSEATSNAVLSSVGNDGFKKSLRHDNYIPNVAIVDPALTMQCPQELSINCAMDAFTQLVESYLSTNASPYTDSLALGAIGNVEESLLAVCKDEPEIYHRSNISYAALISGITLANAGLGVIHGFASIIGGLFSIPHGVVCGTLMAPANDLTLKKLKTIKEPAVALQKYAQLGKVFSKKSNATEEYYQDAFIDELYRISSLVKLAKLSDYGVGKADIEVIVGQTGNKYNPVQLGDDALYEIVASRI